VARSPATPQPRPVARVLLNAAVAIADGAGVWLTSPLASGACAVPLLTPYGCVGVLAIELRGDTVQKESVRALAMIFGAQLARVVEATLPAVGADWRDGRDAAWPPS